MYQLNNPKQFFKKQNITGSGTYLGDYFLPDH